MRKRCYPKYSYIIGFIVSFLMLLFSVFPIFIQTNDTLKLRIVCSLTLLFFSLISLAVTFWQLQYYEIHDNTIVVKCLWGTIISINIDETTMAVETLPTYFSWAITINKQWICLYSKTSSKFTSGCSNNKKHKRIQIIYSDETYRILNKLLKTQNNSRKIS